MDRLSEFLDLQALATQVAAWVPDAIAALIIVLLFRLLYTATSLPLRKLLKRTGLHETLIRMLVDNVYRYAVLIFGLIMAADQLHINVAAALAGIGVVGVAFGFAAQDTLSNIIAGFLIFIDKPFEVGDWVTVQDLSGGVVNITMRTTRLRTRQNTFVVIPNRKIIDEVLVNHSKQGATRVHIPLGIAYKESIPGAREVILRAVAGLPAILKEPAPDVVVDGLGDSSVNLLIRVWVDDASMEQPVSNAVIEAAKLALDDAGIEIPFPHLQLFVDEIREPVWRRAAAYRGLAVSDSSPS